MKFSIQHHAIERFVQYYQPGIPDSQVLKLILDMLGRATQTKEKSSCGDPIWTCDGVRFVLKFDYGTRGAKSRTKKHAHCVTVLPPKEEVETADPYYGYFDGEELPEECPIL